MINFRFFLLRGHLFRNLLDGRLAFGTMIDNFNKRPIAGSGKLFRALMNSLKKFFLYVVPEANCLNTYANLNHPVTNPLKFLWSFLFHEFTNIFWDTKQ